MATPGANECTKDGHCRINDAIPEVDWIAIVKSPPQKPLNDGCTCGGSAGDLGCSKGIHTPPSLMRSFFFFFFFLRVLDYPQSFCDVRMCAKERESAGYRNAARSSPGSIKANGKLL